MPKMKIKKALHKSRFYINGWLLDFVPDAVYRTTLAHMLNSVPPEKHESISYRVNYYNKINANFRPSEAACRLDEIKPTQSRAYYYDFRKVMRFFPKKHQVDYAFGDIVNVPSHPSFLKSRPVSDGNQNSILLKLNSVRHFYTEKDPLPFDRKLGKAVWRGAAYMSWRQHFVQQAFKSKLCDIGQTDSNAKGQDTWKPYMSPRGQMAYKYIISVEGRDVATNLKWIMQSNSLCLMQKPKFETWFMEGCLKPGVHYAEIDKNHSNIEDLINYYNENPREAKQIIENANSHAARFSERRNEDLISLLVVAKYFKLSNQL